VEEDLKKEVPYGMGVTPLVDEKQVLNAYRSLIDQVGEMCADTGGAIPIAVSLVFAEPGNNNTTLFSAKTKTRKKDSEKRLQDIIDRAMMEWIKEEFGEGIEVPVEPWVRN